MAISLPRPPAVLAATHQQTSFARASIGKRPCIVPVQLINKEFKEFIVAQLRILMKTLVLKNR